MFFGSVVSQFFSTLPAGCTANNLGHQCAVNRYLKHVTEAAVRRSNVPVANRRLSAFVRLLQSTVRPRSSILSCCV